MNTLKTEKTDIAYHVGKWAWNSLKSMPTQLWKLLLRNTITFHLK